MRLYRLYEGRGTSTWNSYAVVGEETPGVPAPGVSGDMTDKPDCVRCQRIKSAIEQGISPHAAREENGWDECSRDGCPMLPRPYSLKNFRNGGISRAA
jgi:hypothetical protein